MYRFRLGKRTRNGLTEVCRTPTLLKIDTHIFGHGLSRCNDGIYAVPKSSVFDKVSPTTVYKPKDGVARGSLVLDKEQYAYTGWSAHTYRYIYDKDGNELEKQDMGGSKYKMRPNTYFYNPADGDPSTWVNGKPPAPEQPSTPEAPANPDTPEAPDPATPEPEEPDVTVPPPGVELDLNPI